ncbi:MAG: LmeA family phospholipid-binding protein [Waterburya sp.]
MNQPDLGEQAISKAAEIGIKNQLDEVEDLNVDVRANPLDLVSGKLESVTVDGKGMVMNKELRAERLILQTDEIAINSIKAALGNIELTQETNAKAKIVLLEEDLQQAFNSEYIKGKLQNQKLDLNGETVTVNASNVKFTLPGDNKIGLEADIEIAESQTIKHIALSAKPILDADGNKIAITDVEHYDQENAAFAQALLDSTEELLDLRNFQLNTMSLKLDKLDVGQGKIIMAASAVLREFPDS